MSKSGRPLRLDDIDGMTCSHDDSRLSLEEAIAHRQVEHPTCLSCQGEVLMARAFIAHRALPPHTKDPA